ncbi:MAG: M18 family aminopeptidase [Oscillospiraceae bacterium]|nr:M18 family aminopeptidase [Oscillospiraceae bacterium]
MVQSMLHFIEKSPTCFHVVKNCAERLEQEGYVPLCGREILPGGKYYITQNGSALIAFRIPESAADGFTIAASHSDSPCFRVRDHAELAGSYVRLSCERYGGMINASWVDRPLGIAGRVMVLTKDGIEQRLVDFGKDTVLIPNVAIHMNRSMNEGLSYDPKTDLVPLYGLSDAKGSFRRELAALAGCEEDAVLASDLFVYNGQRGTVWGADSAFVSAPRLDDLACVYTSLEAFLQAEAGSIPVLAVFDNEEIGSETKQGAGSVLLMDILKDVCRYLGMDYSRSLAHSFMLSCDNGHGLHPNHPELADRTEAPVLGGGVIVKHSPRYATDALSCAVFTEVCRRALVPIQHYSNRPDQAGGATLGNIAATRTPVLTADIGMAQLAMHSAFETAACADVPSMIRAVKAVYEMRLTVQGDAIGIG